MWPSTRLLAPLMLASCSQITTSFQPQSLPSSVLPFRLNHLAVSAVPPTTETRLVALTREHGKNSKLAALLKDQGIATVEVPCIEHGVGPGRAELPGALQQSWGYVVCTSPEAAQVLLDGWAEAGQPEGLWKLASVGASTSKALQLGGLQPDFEPTKATAATLAKELPETSPMTVLYPASSLAADTLQLGLSARGFIPSRLNTYTTQPASWDSDVLAAARSAQIVTFASPSAVKVWAERVGTNIPVACIGETSAEASRKNGFWKIQFPEKPGMDGWVKSVLELM